ncbi:nicotinate-nucleotide--dimethylbenzimidazole phosphoribosyltransferase [Treponema primitia ZAS-2]|uniref:Nicotinate-nucleotide--dimethylbenzimidazole phosphoribosyltransferase n=1 Tax=Treponema primitia (strain ATCC BAA-887 / DSM 12427 / ZAS-2) TaxID=545694 RepID=F5YL98_TREPZ|nr:nicotinate-nucleotide--dimethylbenzimidazole phosphoribosyltransferase [Treponema primitia]AEF83666.1 nicotinate-nucleotide--dimethylbenzimidazole phosphoribosyltransferase [Treponema primitia ZAS-2]
MENIRIKMEAHLDDLTKPRGSLGKLESYCIKMAEIQGKVPPRVEKKGVYVFASDHGIATEGVSLYPQEVTRQMVLNILSGGAGINALAGGTGWEIIMVDAGVIGEEFPPDLEVKPGCTFVRARVGNGCRNSFKEDALTPEETEKALAQGKVLAQDAADRGLNIIAIGDLGISNTSTAAAMLVAAGFNIDDMVDRGTGIDKTMLEHKRHIIQESVKLRNSPKNGKAILQKLGSFDFAMMAGLILGLEGKGIACVIDGFPVTSAAYMAYMINPKVSDWLFAGHLSKVVGHKPVLDRMGLDPIVNLDMRLGEGTGAVIGGHIIELGVRAAREMASFSQAHVSGGETKEEKY